MNRDRATFAPPTPDADPETLSLADMNTVDADPIGLGTENPTFHVEPVWKLRSAAVALSALAHGAVALLLALHWVPDGLGIGPEGIPVDIVSLEDAPAETISTGASADAEPANKPARAARPAPAVPQYERPVPQPRQTAERPKPLESATTPPDEPRVTALRPNSREPAPIIDEAPSIPLEQVESLDVSTQYLEDPLLQESPETPIEEAAEPTLEQMEPLSDVEPPAADPVEETIPAEPPADPQPILEALTEPVPEAPMPSPQEAIPEEAVPADAVSMSDILAAAATDPLVTGSAASLLTYDATALANPGDSELDEPLMNPAATSGMTDTGSYLTAREIEALREQLYRCWNLPDGLSRSDNVRVVVRIEVAPNRLVLRADLDQTSGTINHPSYRSVADSALRAIRGCGPLNLPAQKFEAWNKMRITFESIHGGSSPVQPASPDPSPLPVAPALPIQPAASDPIPLPLQPVVPDSSPLPASASNVPSDSPESVQLTVREIIAIQRQLVDCWTLPRGINQSGEIRVVVQVAFAPDGTVLAAEIAEAPTPSSHPAVEAVAVSALKAIHDCSPVAMPVGKYEAWKSFRMTFVTG